MTGAAVAIASVVALNSASDKSKQSDIMEEIYDLRGQIQAELEAIQSYEDARAAGAKIYPLEDRIVALEKQLAAEGLDEADEDTARLYNARTKMMDEMFKIQWSRVESRWGGIGENAQPGNGG